MPFFLSLLLGPVLLLIGGFLRRRTRATQSAGRGHAAPLNFLNFGRRRDPLTLVDEPEGFVPHAWADRETVDEGLL